MLDHVAYISTQEGRLGMLTNTNIPFSFILLGLWNFIWKDELRVHRHLEEKIIKIHIF